MNRSVCRVVVVLAKQIRVMLHWIKHAKDRVYQALELTVFGRRIIVLDVQVNESIWH
jgi:hypothetical protein